MPTRLLRSRTTIGVSDVLASARFYERTVGFQVIVSMGEPPTFALIGSDQVGLGLVASSPPLVTGFACCYVDVVAVEELHQRCLASGATVSPLTRQPWGSYDFVLADPDGHQIAFGEPPA
jgi:predicted enzyme related to lactoylglutathione lyase